MLSMFFYGVMTSIISFPVNMNNNISNINSHQLIGGCAGTQYGCCEDAITPCNITGCGNCINNISNISNISNINSHQLIGGCAGTQYGCCEDEITPCNITGCGNCINNMNISITKNISNNMNK